jgi:hypothetical protein
MAALRLVDSTRAARFNALTHGRPSRPGSKGYSAEELLIAFSLARGRSLLRCTQRPPLPPEGWGSSSLRLCWYSHSFFPFGLHAMCAYPAGRPVCWWRCLQANSVGEGNTGTLTHARTHPHTHTCAVAWHGLPCAPFNGVSTVVCCCIMGSQLLSCARSRMTYAHTHTHSRATACAVGGRAASALHRAAQPAGCGRWVAHAAITPHRTAPLHAGDVRTSSAAERSIEPNYAARLTEILSCQIVLDLWNVCKICRLRAGTRSTIIGPPHYRLTTTQLLPHYRLTTAPHRTAVM